MRAAGAMGTVMILSSGSTYTLEDVAQAATGTIWFQQYLYKDQGLTRGAPPRAGGGLHGPLSDPGLDCAGEGERNIRNNYSSPSSPNYAGLECRSTPGR